MNKFTFDDYKELIIQQVESLEKGGRGQFARIAKHLGVHTTFVTHVLRGASHLSVEQGIKICDFFLFSELETDFFIQLLQFNRAGDQKTRDFFSKKLAKKRRIKTKTAAT